jgi:hypothetical protein
MKLAYALLFAAAAALPAAPRAQSSALSIDKPAAALTADARSKVVETIAATAEQRYVDAAGGRLIAARLRQQLAAGAYNDLADPSAFAKALTTDMRAAVPDVHLRAVYEPNRSQQTASPLIVQAGAPQGMPPAAYARIDSRSVEQIAASNYGFDKVERLAGNVAYLKLSKLVPLALSQEAATKAMKQLAGSDAVIVDLRGVPGGSPDTVVQLVSYFTGAKPVHLMTSVNRAANETEQLSSLPAVPGPRLTGVPLYVLQDRKSASAAEMFSYFVQRQKLGTIVGERSAGAGNGGNMVPVGYKISFFIPERRVTDGPGWERTGITPDIETSGGDAFDKAYAEALQRIATRKSRTKS